jgi:RluA family pseudouridine synthase
MHEPVVLHEDEGLIAVDKPAGMATAAGGGIDDDASLHAWVTRNVGAPTLIVHRLDRGTSGAVVFAKTAEAHRRLSQAFEAREVGKRYLALVDGHLPDSQGRIDQPLRQYGSGRVGVDPGGRDATTDWALRERLPDADLLDVMPLTGRRHQIRAHLYSIGHPILGDTIYGDHRPVGGAPRLMLHAAELTFRDGLTVRADPPEDFVQILRSAGR